MFLWSILTWLKIQDGKPGMSDDEIISYIDDYVNKVLQSVHHQIGNYTQKQIRRLKVEYARLDPLRQASLRKVLLDKIPTKPMRVDVYLTLVEAVCGKQNVEFSIGEWEVLIHKLGLVKNGLVCYDHNPELLELAKWIL